MSRFTFEFVLNLMCCKICRTICQPHQIKNKKYKKKKFARLLRRSQDNIMIFDFVFFPVSFMKAS